MKEKDLIEFLRSTIESDALISRIFNLFHLNYKYSIKELNSLIDYGVQNGYFTIEDVEVPNKTYKEVDWKPDNIYQEVLIINEERYIKSLFSGEGTVPEEFKKFLVI